MNRRAPQASKIIGFVALSTLSLLTLFVDSSAGAVDGTINQRILPLECVFQTVNDGLGTIIYLTPEECGQSTLPLPVDPNPSGVGAPQSTIIQNSENIIYQLPFVAPSMYTLNYAGIGETIQDLPRTSKPRDNIDSTQSQALIQKNETAARIAGTVVIIGVLFLLLILLIMLL